jgi:hypothetical protein
MPQIMKDYEIGTRGRITGCECPKCEDLQAEKAMYLSATFGDYDNIFPKETEELTEHQYLICGSHMVRITEKIKQPRLFVLSFISF